MRPTGDASRWAFGSRFPVASVRWGARGRNCRQEGGDVWARPRGAGRFGRGLGARRRGPGGAGARGPRTFAGGGRALEAQLGAQPAGQRVRPRQRVPREALVPHEVPCKRRRVLWPPEPVRGVTSVTREQVTPTRPLSPRPRLRSRRTGQCQRLVFRPGTRALPDTEPTAVPAGGAGAALLDGRVCAHVSLRLTDGERGTMRGVSGCGTERPLLRPRGPGRDWGLTGRAPRTSPLGPERELGPGV